MIIVPKKNLYLPERIWGRKRFQRGIICATAVFSAGGFITISGEVVSVTGPAGSIVAGIRFNTDGSIDKRENSVYTQVDPGEYWSNEPETGIGSNYDVRALSAGKTGTWSQAAEIDDTWIQISANREWVVLRFTAGTKQCIATFEMRNTGSGSALDDAVYDCTATRT